MILDWTGWTTEEWSGPERREREGTHDHICCNVVTAKLAGVCFFCRRPFNQGDSIVVTKVNQKQDGGWFCFDCATARMVQLLRAAFGEE